MRGSATVEFLLSFLLALGFAAIISEPLLKGFSTLPEESGKLIAADAYSCYDYYSVKVESTLCIENVCNGTAISGKEGKCEKRSLLD